MKVNFFFLLVTLGKQVTRRCKFGKKLQTNCTVWEKGPASLFEKTSCYSFCYRLARSQASDKTMGGGGGGEFP